MSTLPGTVQPAAPGLLGFDTATIVSSSVAASFKSSGYAFCVRYLSRGTTQGSGDLSNAEALGILNAGLALMAVQHVRMPGWTPTAALGTQDGTNGANNAKSIGLPTGMNIWCDLEGVADDTTAQAVIDYCQAWYTAVKAAGYVPGLYVGAAAVLTSQQLYSNLSFQHYWRSLSTVPDVAVRGYQLKQAYVAGTVHGIGIDSDTTMNDNKGGTCLWLKI